MILRVRKMGDPILLRPAVRVRDFSDPKLKELVANMWDTMEATGGVGIAAPQVGVSLQVICFGMEKSLRYPGAPSVPRTVLINPKIEPIGDERQIGWEGCLSVPGLRAQVPRWERIRYTGFDLEGNPIDREVTGFHARVVQHESDHLIGRLYPSCIEDFSTFGYVELVCSEALKGEEEKLGKANAE